MASYSTLAWHLGVAGDRRNFVVVDAESGEVLRDGGDGCENDGCVAQHVDELSRQRQHRVGVGRVERIQLAV